MSSGERSSSLMSKRSLVLGNARYEDGGTCKFSANNAEDMAKTLREIGFQVTVAADLNYKDMSKAIDRFTQDIRRDDWVVFYFAGQSAQWRNRLYLVPIDNQCLADQPTMHEKYAIAVQTILDEMVEQKPLATIFLFDCVHLDRSRTSAVGKPNLIPLHGCGNSLITLACGQKEQISHRSPDQRHSLFTEHLLRHLAETNVKVEEMIIRVCDAVHAEAAEKVCICRFSCLHTSEIYLNATKTPAKLLFASPALDQSWLNLQFHDAERTSIVKPAELESQLTLPTKVLSEKIFERIAGSMLGLAIGDALGAHVEFRPHEYLLEHPVTDLTAGGTWGLEKGQFTDDTSMALCLANSLIACHGFNPYDQLVRYKWWYRHGYLSSTGKCFDIGTATKDSLEQFERLQNEWAKKLGLSVDQLDGMGTDERLKDFPVDCDKEGTAGNGALMRLAAVPLFFFRQPAMAVEYSGLSSNTTHADVRSADACRYYAALIVGALRDFSKADILDDRFYDRHRTWFGKKEIHPDILSIARGSYRKRNGYDDGIRGGGYVVKALEAALWAFWSTCTFEEGALAAVNLGDDTDTTAAIYGQLAGAHYGWKSLPKRWLEHLYAQKLILTICHWIGCEGAVFERRGREATLNGIRELPDAVLIKFHQNFQGDDYTLPLRIFGVSVQFQSCVLRYRSADEEHRRAYRKIVRWVDELPPETEIGRVKLLFPTDRYRRFLDRILSTEPKVRQREFQPHLDDETSPLVRRAALDRVRLLAEKVRNQRSVSIARVWHGCSRSKMHQIVAQGFQERHKLANGLYGKGIYFSSTARAAAIHAGFDGYLIMCYVILLNPFPVISDDVYSGSLSKQNFRFYRSERHSNYQCHFVPILPVLTGKGVRNLPPINGIHMAQFDQLVIFDPTDILDQVVIEVKRKRNDRFPRH